MKEIIKDVVIAAIIAIIVIQFIRPTVVKESSMEATLFENNYIFFKQAGIHFRRAEERRYNRFSFLTYKRGRQREAFN